MPPATTQPISNDRMQQLECNNAELLAELEKAHLIIRNAAACMNTQAKLVWSDKNIEAGIDGHCTTRISERASLIRRAKAA